MRFIPTRLHGLMDYLTGVILIGAPWVLDFANGDAAHWIPVLLGIGLIAYSLLTDYELGVVKLIPMPAHLGPESTKLMTHTWPPYDLATAVRT